MNNIELQLKSEKQRIKYERWKAQPGLYQAALERARDRKRLQRANNILSNKVGKSGAERKRKPSPFTILRARMIVDELGELE